MSPPLTSQVAHVGAVVRYVLEELRVKNQEFGPDRLPLLIFGPSDDAANAAPPSIYWLPMSEGVSGGQRQGAAAAPGALLNRTVTVSFLLFGGVEAEGTYTDAEAPYHDCDLTEVLLSKLVNCCQRNLSQFSYTVDSVTWSNGGKTGIGMSCEVVIGIKLPLIREDNPTVRVTGIDKHVEFDKP